MVAHSRRPLSPKPQRVPQSPQIIRLTFSEIDCSHRFVQAKVQIKNRKLFHQAFEKYISSLSLKEQGMKFYNLKEDSDITEECQQQHVATHSASSDTLLSFTAMVINDLRHFSSDRASNQVDYSRVESQSYASGQVFFVSLDTLQTSAI